MKHYFILLISAIWAFTTLPAAAQNPGAADAAYRKGDFARAAALYEAELKEGPAFTLYYNLGNTYYRLNDYGKAVLNYQRALRINPASHQARTNLELTQSKLPDRFDRPDEMFFITFGRMLLNWQSERGWAIFALVMLALTLMSILIYWFPRSVVFRKVGFSCFLLFFMLTILGNVFAALQISRFRNNRQAVVQTDVNLSISPDATSKVIYRLHEGTTVEIADNSIKGWYQVQLPDASVGWLPASGVERVAP